MEPIEQREARWELLREAQWSLRLWERHRRALDRDRCFAALVELAAMMRAAGE